MLRNLKAEMVRQDVKPADLADLLHVRYATILDKLNGHYDFSFNDALKIKRRFFPNLGLEYLFSSDGDKSAQSKKQGVS